MRYPLAAAVCMVLAWLVRERRRAQWDAAYTRWHDPRSWRRQP